MRASLKTMVYAKAVNCRVEEFSWMSPTTFKIRFSSSKNFSFKAGQFVSVVVPKQLGNEAAGTVKRCYSLSSSPDHAKISGYELCVKLVPGGLGSTYMAGLKVGDTFQASAPYGHFVMKSEPGRTIVFISTATGIAPFRSIVMSQDFKTTKPKRTVFVTGSRSEDEILYPIELESTGIEVVRAVSQSTEGFTGFKGRVTDYLRSLPSTWCWHETDFYICGNPEMVVEVEEILRTGRGVNPKNIYRELFSASKTAKAAKNVVSIRRPQEEVRIRREKTSLIPELFRKLVGR